MPAEPLPPEFWEAVSDAMKIGIPTVIGVVSVFVTYKIAKLQQKGQLESHRLAHERELERVRDTRSREIIEEVAAQIERYCDAAKAFHANTATVKNNQDQWEEVPKFFQESHRERHSSLAKASNEAAVAESKLLLLRDQDSFDRVQKIRGVVNDMVRLRPLSNAKTTATVEQIDQLTTRMHEARAELYASLAERYN